MHEPGGTPELAKALATAQGEMSNATLNKENPHFKSKYADLAAIRDATIPALTKHGLSLVQYMQMHEHGLFLHTRLQHQSGEWIEGEYPLPVSEKAHAMGSAITYAKRYSWSAMCGISADDDDDGNAAQAEGGKVAAKGDTKKTTTKEDGDPMKTEAERVAKGIDNSDTLIKLNAYMKEQSKTLEAIKEASETAYDFLIVRASNRRTMFAQEPLDETASAAAE